MWKTSKRQLTGRDGWSLRSILATKLPRRASTAYRLRLESLESRQLLAGDLLITEVTAINRHSLLDLDGYASDWFEVHNPTADPISLLGYSVTDDPAIPDKWSFSDVTLESGGYLVVFASEKDRSGGDLRVRVKRDFHATPDGTFLVDLPNDTYDVRMTMGDTDRIRDDMDIYIQGVLVDTVTTQVGEITDRTYMAQVDAGQLAIRLDDTGGETGRAVINGLTITPVDGVGEERCFDFGPTEFFDLKIGAGVFGPEPGLIGPVEPGYTPVSISDTYLAAVGYGWQAGTVVSEQDREGTDGEQHTNFQFSSAGDYLALVFGGMVVSEFGAGIDFPQQFTDVSYGIVGNTPGSEAHYFVEPTPGAANDAASIAIGFVADTTFSVDRGFYDAPFNVEITTSTPGAAVAYTTDGTEPTLQNGTVIGAPDAQTPPTATVLIDETTVLRAAAFRDNYVPTNIDAQTYLFVDDIVLQDAQATLAAGFSFTWAGTSTDYGLDPDVIGQNGQDLFGGLYAGTIRDDLKSIPTVSFVLDVDDMFGAEGIYANPQGRGRPWERPVSVEYIDPATGADFQLEAGVRIQGGASRSPGRKKHSFRLFFKDLFAAPKLEFPFFGGDATDRFDTITLRANANDNWLAQNKAHYTRDEFIRRSQIATGNPASHGRFVHLYINGFYWGLYNPVERPDESFGATYFGGDKDSWDVIKQTHNVGQEAVAGTMEAWDAMLAITNEIFSATNEAERTAVFQQVQGNNPDGSNNPAWEDYLDVDNYIDYLIVNLFGGNTDWPGHNYYMSRLRGPESTGFKFFSWDAEEVLALSAGVSVNRINAIAGAGPGVPYGRLRNSEEFRLLFADHIHRHFFNDGAMTRDVTTARFQELIEENDGAIVGESARWGDVISALPITRADWLAEGDRILNDFLAVRSDLVLGHFRDADPPLYPANDAPEFEINGQPQHGGTIVPGAGLTLDDLEQAGATVYYTLTGVDPREIGGAVSASALTFQPGVDPAITLNETTQVKAQILDGSGEWSALTEALFAVAAPELRITELNYNPYDPTAAELAAGITNNDEFEFIELENVGPTTTNLLGTTFSDGVGFTFPSMLLDAGERVVVVKNQTAFETRYGMGVNIAGEFTTGSLRNSGENMTLVGPDNITTILDFAYNDNDPWPERSDGNGGTLELVDPLATPAEESGKYYRWRGSTELGGSPGTAGSEPLGVVINEVLANTDTPIPSDSIELYNPTGSTLDIGGLYLSDPSANFLKYQIPIGTMLGAGAYMVFDESDFNPSDGIDPNDFGLSGAEGDDVWLTVPDGSGGIASFVDDVHFGASASGESFGRSPNGSGRLAPMRSLTLEAANSAPRVGPLVVSEVHYHPLDPSPADLAIDPNLVDDDLEFVEVFNPTGDPVDLTDWRIRSGVDFDFDAGTMIGPGETLVVISFNPDSPTNVNRLAAFRAHFGIDNSVTLLGGYADQLNNNGEKVKLQRPDVPTGIPLMIIPRLQEDEVLYDDLNPWPTDADGTGKSLNRISATAYGNLAASWTAQDPTPGSASFNKLGDMDLDDDLDFDDIDDFVLGLSDMEAYEAMYGVPATFNGDTDQDDDLDFDDIDDFVLLLSSGGGLQAGDMNADGHVNDGDVAQLVQGLFDPESYEEKYGVQATILGDTDGDGDLDFDDIAGFVSNLSSGHRSAPPRAASAASRMEPFRTVRWATRQAEQDTVWSQPIDWLNENWP